MHLHDESESAEPIAAIPPATDALAVGEPSHGWAIALALALIALAGLAVYWDSFSGGFVFDDVPWGERATGVWHLWPIWTPLVGTIRPLVDWSFAVNYAIEGSNTWGYHAVNLAVHLAAAFALFGVVRRSLVRGRLAARFAGSAWGLALAVALLWVVHPLQTQGVTYIYQRYEAMMGLFVLLTLYGFIRAEDSAAPIRWYAASAACCLLAVTSKEVAAVAPLLVLWYDRALVASSWREIVRRRWAYYAALLATWPVLAALMLGQAHRFAAAGVLVVKNVTPLQYAVSQPGVIAHYLRLCFWPTGQCIDYGWPVATTAGAIMPPSLLIAALLAITVWAIFRRPAWSFLGAWFFLILAPTSSIFPIRDLAFEHRMYLPLAAVIVVVVIGVWSVGRWLMRHSAIPLPALQAAGGILAILACAALGSVAFQRNLVYQSRVSMWEDVLAQVPDNSRAHYNLGVALAHDEETDEAIAEYEKALNLSPNYSDAHNNLGMALAKHRRFDEAIVHYRRALAGKPDFAEAHCNLAMALAALGQTDESIAEYRKAIELNPDLAEAHNNLANALIRRGQIDEAIAHFDRALALTPDCMEAHFNLALALAGRRRFDEAVAHFRAALELKPDYAECHNHLGSALSALGRPDEAIERFRNALELKPDYGEARNNLGIALAKRGRPDDAIAQFQIALRVKPNDAIAHNNLGIVLVGLGRTDEAIAHYQEALELDPEYADAHNNLGMTLASRGRIDEAVAHFRKALEIKPDFAAARKNLAVALAEQGKAD